MEQGEARRDLLITFVFEYPQDFLEGKASYVSVAMDDRAGIRYGTDLCIPEVNHRYHRVVVFKVGGPVTLGVHRPQ